MKAKKWLALLLACCMVFALLAGCADEGTKTPDAENTGTAVDGGDTAQTDMPKYKIGIIAHTNSGGCWERVIDAAQYMAGELNCTVSAAVGSSADAILTEAENFIASGVDGLIVMNDGGITSRLVQLCEDAGVYIVFSDCGLSVTEDDDYSTYSNSKYYLGHVSHDEYADSYACARDMIDNGATKFVVFGLPPGISSNFDKRAVGAMDAITEAGLTYVEARSYSMAELANNLMSQYPDTDAIFSFVTTPDSFNVVDMASKYAGKIQISAYMVGDVSYEFDVGFLTHVAVGTEARIQLAFALLYSGMRGYRVENADGTPAEIEFAHLWIKSGEDFKTFYSAVTGGSHAYSIDEMKQLMRVFNPDAVPEDYQVIANAFSAADGWLADQK